MRPIHACSAALALAVIAAGGTAGAQDPPSEKPSQSPAARPAPPRAAAPAKEKRAPEAEDADSEAPPDETVAGEEPVEADEEAEPESPEDDPMIIREVPATDLEPEQSEPAEEPRETKPAAKKQRRALPSAAVMTPISSEPPAVLPYREGQAVPDGYRPDTEMRTGLVIGGAITFAIPYLSSVAVALRARRDAEEGFMDPDEANGLAPLYAPIAGPFIAIHTTGSDTTREIAPLAAAGLVQTAGAVMFLAGLVSKKKVLVREEKTSAQVTPLVSGETLGLGVSGKF